MEGGVSERGELGKCSDWEALQKKHFKEEVLASCVNAAERSHKMRREN